MEPKGGGQHSLAGDGAGEPIRETGETAWHSVYSVITRKYCRTVVRGRAYIRPHTPLSAAGFRTGKDDVNGFFSTSDIYFIVAIERG